MDLSKFKNIHKGKRAFLTACGPSLNLVNSEILKNEIVFGVSLSYKKDNIKPTYSFMGDKNIASQFYPEILQLDNIWFVSKSIYDSYLNKRPNTYFFTSLGKKEFSKDLSSGKIYGGGTSTFLAMQFAYFMGIQELIIVGLDHYKTYNDTKSSITKTNIKNKDNKELVISTGDDPHHFDKNFYGKGTKYYLPSVKKMEESYKLASIVFEEGGRRLVNASLETDLSENIIKRITL